MTYAEDRKLREKLSKASGSRAFRDAFDNEKNAIRIATLRHDRAVLLGYKSHAHFVLEERMAETPEKVVAFWNEYWTSHGPRESATFATCDNSNSR